MDGEAITDGAASEDSSCLHRPTLAWQVASAETVLWGVCSWIGGPNSFYRFIADIDAILMGRGSFEAVRYTEPWLYTRPVLVLSRSLTDEQCGSACQLTPLRRPSVTPARI
mgnify:CR=1 FL=1